MLPSAIGSRTPLLIPRVVVLLVFVLVIFFLVLIVIGYDSGDVVNFCFELRKLIVGFVKFCAKLWGRFLGHDSSSPFRVLAKFNALVLGILGCRHAVEPFRFVFLA